MTKLKNYEFKQCRTFLHAWDEIDRSLVEHQLPRRTGKVVVLRCTRCTTLRDEIWSRTGQVVYRKYHYPDGYALSRDDYGLGGTPREQMRVAYSSNGSH